VQHAADNWVISRIQYEESSSHKLCFYAPPITGLAACHGELTRLVLKRKPVSIVRSVPAPFVADIEAVKSLCIQFSSDLSLIRTFQYIPPLHSYQTAASPHSHSHPHPHLVLGQFNASRGLDTPPPGLEYDRGHHLPRVCCAGSVCLYRFRHTIWRSRDVDLTPAIDAALCMNK
jgi:hypothetical protein